MTNEKTMLQTRTTKYIQATLAALQKRGHATNLEILSDLRNIYPNLTATTVHRITARLYERGSIGCAPLAEDGSCRYDITPQIHHHFICTRCNSTCDVSDTDAFRKLVEQMKLLSSNCASIDMVTAQGICRSCFKKGEI